MQEVKKLFQKFFGDLDDAKIYLFGSRATGKHKEFSDIDIAINSKSKDITKRIALFNEGWEKSNLPYKADITAWKDIYRPYLPQIRKEKVTLWQTDEQELHSWRACPYGQHWVVRHPRYPVGRQLQDVDGHCRKNPSGKDILKGDEIDFISKVSPFQDTRPLPCPYKGSGILSTANQYDVLIAGWCKYWNDIFKPDRPLEPNFVKALIYSESKFKPTSIAKNKKEIGPARGLIQITEQSWRILKNKKGEIKDHYVDLTKEELFEPSKNICAGIRWLFRKREIIQKKSKLSPEWIDVMIEYKGIKAGLKKNDSTSLRILKEFKEFYDSNSICS
jgi:predicted nucleotidyltransferase